MYQQRHISDRLLRLVDSFPIVVVSGARQVGKTTLVRHCFPKWDYELFDPLVDVGNARGDPDLFLNNRPPPIILDEIQYVPELVPALKRRIDLGAQSNGQFILTGSQQWQVMRSLAESLAGRVVFLDLKGFSLAERAGENEPVNWLRDWLTDADGFTDARAERLDLKEPLYETIWRGDLPKATLVAQDLVPDFHTGYQRSYIERDVRTMADVADWHQFSRFLRMAGALTSQEINFSHLGRELDITPQTARRWLKILEASFQWVETPPFAGNLVKRVSGKPKGYVTNTGMICHGQQISSPTTLGGHPLLGALFETAVAMELHKQADLLPVRPAFYHWRSAGGAEVDIVMELDGKLYPFEIKTATHPGPRDISGLKAFQKSYPNLKMAPGALIAPVDRVARLSDDVVAIPWDLKALRHRE